MDVNRRPIARRYTRPRTVGPPEGFEFGAEGNVNVIQHIFASAIQ